MHDNVVLLGDAAHTAHFSIGSGTKLAMEDALALAACLHEEPTTLDGALATYEEERKAVVLSTQRAAQASLEWFENLGQYVHQEPDPVRLQHHDPQRGGSPTTTCACATRSSSRACEAWFADRRSRRHGRRRTPADVPAVTPRCGPG